MALAAGVSKLLKATRKTAKVHLPDDIRTLTGFKPRPLQEDMARRMRRFNSWVVHRRFGKSVLAVNTLVERAIECPHADGRYAYLAPTFDMAENIAWTYLKNYASKIPNSDIAESDLSVELPTRTGRRSQITLYGTDTPKQRLRGMYLDGMVADEWAQQPPHVWTQQARPMLSDVNRAGIDDLGNDNQWAIFMFTPFGRNHAYHMHRRAELWARGEGVKLSSADNDVVSSGAYSDALGVEDLIFRNDWSAEYWPASKTGVLAPEELRSAKLDMNDDEAYAQEYECSFDAAIRGAIYAKGLAEIRDRGLITRVAYNPMLPVHTAWDLGVDDCTAIWFFQMVGLEIRIIDYYEFNGVGLDHYADVLEKKGYGYGKHYLPHDVEVVELGTGKSRASVLRGLGVRPTTVPRTAKADQIAAGRQTLKRCVFDEARTDDGRSRLQLYHYEYDERTLTFRKEPKHDWTSHAADAFHTLAIGVKRFAPDQNDDFQGSRTAELDGTR
ncbi:MAG: hypothetical protein AB7U76_24395 [Pirellulales bacterium]